LGFCVVLVSRKVWAFRDSCYSISPVGFGDALRAMLYDLFHVVLILMLFTLSKIKIDFLQHCNWVNKAVLPTRYAKSTKSLSDVIIINKNDYIKPPVVMDIGFTYH
jgi:hypothetical protein